MVKTKTKTNTAVKVALIVLGFSAAALVATLAIKQSNQLKPGGGVSQSQKPNPKPASGPTNSLTAGASDEDIAKDLTTIDNKISGVDSAISDSDSDTKNQSADQ